MACFNLNLYVKFCALIESMFYFKEILFRIKYILMSFFLTFFICFLNKDLLFFFITFSFLFPNNDKQVYYSGVEYLIYTHPSELLSTYIAIISYFTFIPLLYYFVWHIADFMKSSLKYSEFQSFDNIIFRSAGVFCLLNILFLFFIFPSCWNFFESFNETLNISTTLRFFLELKITDYISFLKNLLYTTNVGLILIFSLLFFLYSQDFIDVLLWKNFFSFCCFVFLTTCIPADVLGQAVNILMLNIFVELMILTRIFKLKFRTQIQFLTVIKK